MPQQIRRKTAPNDVPTLLFVMVLVLVQWCFNSTSAVLGSALLGVVPVLCVVAFSSASLDTLKTTLAMAEHHEQCFSHGIHDHHTF